LARIVGGGGKPGTNTVGRPGFKQLATPLGGFRRKVGITRLLRQNVNRLMVRDPAKNQEAGRPVLTKATLTTAMAGANNDLKFTSKQRGTDANNIRVRIVVAGANTALSVSVSTNDITVNSATNGSSVATSTAAQVKAAIEASTPAKALVDVAFASGNDGSGVVAAFAFTALTGGKEPAFEGTDVNPNPTIVKQSAESRRNLKLGRGGEKVVDTSANRRLRKR
jgi:hypothetical protein